MDAKLRARVRLALRKIYFMSENRREALKRVETATPSLKKDGTPKLRKGVPMMSRRYKCESCGKEGFKLKEVAVNHKYNIGPSPGSRDSIPQWTWNDLIERLFCSSDELEVLCHEDHDKITKEEKKRMRDGKFFEFIKTEGSEYSKKREGKWEW